MKERPILFSAPMVRAILGGTKTQTRRVAKLMKHPDLGNLYEPSVLAREPQQVINRACPYGQPGDRLWVREAFRLVKTLPGGAAGDSVPPSMVLDSTRKFEADGATSLPDRIFGKLRPSIHMPRWASRITLEITGVRVERLQDISEEDANAEGCERLHEDERGYVFRDDRDWKLCPKCGGTRLHDALGGGGGVIHDVDCRECDTYQKRFKHLWQSINGPESWLANPWVWIVEFKRLEQPA